MKSWKSHAVFASVAVGLAGVFLWMEPKPKPETPPPPTPRFVEDEGVARQAVAVMERRGWWAVRGTQGWQVSPHCAYQGEVDFRSFLATQCASSEARALVEADVWYKEHHGREQDTTPGIGRARLEPR